MQEEKVVIFVHGIGGVLGIKDPHPKTLGRLHKALASSECEKPYNTRFVDFKYGPRGAFSSEFNSSEDAVALIQCAQNHARVSGDGSDYRTEGVDIIAHSNGARVVWRALSMGLPLGNIIWLNPALESDVELTELDFKSLTVVTNRYDKAIWFGAIIPFHKFGLGGVKGFWDQDSRIKIIEKKSWRGILSVNHNYLFNKKNMPWLVKLVQNKFWKIN